MKSLDKVIEKIESAWVCPSSDEAAEFCELIEIREEALNYLKELKEMRDTLATAREEAWNKIENFKQKILEEITDNPPLTWDELKAMSGQPVWVEGGVTGYWDIVISVTETWMHCVLDGWRKETHGTEWQAYRKERKL